MDNYGNVDDVNKKDDDGGDFEVVSKDDERNAIEKCDLATPSRELDDINYKKRILITLEKVQKNMAFAKGMMANATESIIYINL